MAVGIVIFDDLTTDELDATFTGFLLNDISKSNFFLILSQHGFGFHAGFQAQSVPALLTFSPIFHSDFTTIVLLARKVRNFGLLMSSPEKCTAAETSNAAIMELVRLVGLFLADRTDVTIVVRWV